MPPPEPRPDALDAVLAVLPAPLRRLARYGVMGVAVSLFYSLTVITLVASRTRLDPTLASVIAFVLTLPVGWLAHRGVSFADRPRDRLQPLRYGLTTGASFAAAVGGMYVITRLAGLSFLLGIAWNWVIIPLANFAAYLMFVFRAPRAGDSAAGGPP